jgi:energy-coupling factor transporter ATP-binding protein EcfA2
MLDEPDINLADIVLWGLCLIDELAAPSLPLRPLYLHASCVVVDGRALLFTGHSTFGKSTISEMLAEAGRKIEDDRAFVLIDEAASTAWVADTSTAAEQWAQHSTLPRRDDWLVPIGGLFWLRKAPTFDLQPRSPATLAADLLDPPLIDTPGAAPARRLGALRMFAEAVPAQELSFRKDASALIDFLQQQGYLNTRSAHKTQL